VEFTQINLNPARVVEEVYRPEPIPLGERAEAEEAPPKQGEDRTLEDLRKLDKFAEEVLEER